MGDTAMSDRKDMSKKIDTRYAIGRKEANAYNTQELRDAFLVDTLMTQGEVVWIYTHYERFMLGSGSISIRLHLVSLG